MRTHEAKLKAMASELREHRAAQLGKKARGKEAEEQRQKEAYLEFEVSLPAQHLCGSFFHQHDLCVPTHRLRLVVKGTASKSGTSWVALGRLLNPSEPQFPLLWDRGNILHPPG